ncbi:MAG: energy transducer TonB, partial [Verrucomicrobiota bacterium]
ELERLRRQEESERKRQAELEAQRLAKKKADDEERARKAALLAAKKQQEQARRSKEQAERAQAQRQLAQKQAEARREAALAKKISTKPVVTRKTQPHYPSSARRAGHQGTTRVTFTVTSSGKVTSARIVASSGHRSLDSAALSAVKKWRFSPAKNGLGQAVSYTISNHPVRFQIQ